MTNCEKFSIECLLRNLSPDIALEVGTLYGGSLQVLSKFSNEVVSIDIDEEVKSRLTEKFQNVVFYSGDSANLLTKILEHYSLNERHVDFILIDGDHTADGVRKDINALIQWQPKKRCVVLMHDSFNPACREGIRTASWNSSPYVQSVELDFVPGVYHQTAFDTAEPCTMWGGFALAVLTPERRVEQLKIQASQQGLFDAVYKVSSHAVPANFRARVAGIARRIMAVC